MLRYILKRTMWLIVMLLAVMFITFSIMYTLQGSWLQRLSAGVPTGTLAGTLNSIGLYGTFFGDFFLFFVRYIIPMDFATILSSSSISNSMLSMRIQYTLILCLSAVVVSWLVGMPLGIAAATHKDKGLDHVITAITVGLGSMPSFWVGLVLLLIFAGTLKLISLLFVGTISLILPIVALSLCNIPIVTGATRSGLLETLDQDFIVTARAKGLKERFVIWRHAVRNSMLPLLSVLGSQLTKAFGGALVIEMVFSIPGLGSMMFDSISKRDYFAAVFCILIAAAISGVVNLLADILYTAVNPSLRQRYE